MANFKIFCTKNGDVKRRFFDTDKLVLTFDRGANYFLFIRSQWSYTDPCLNKYMYVSSIPLAGRKMQLNIL